MVNIKFIRKENRAVAYDNEIEIGECKFKESENTWNIIHTGVDSKYQGQGIAKKLVKCVIENSEKCNKNLIAECSYAIKILEIKKMLAGELYDANYNENLIKERYWVKDKCYDYNQLKPSAHKEKENIIKEIFGKTGNTFTIEQPFMCDYGYNIEIGENFYSNHNLIILDGNKVQFGDNVFIGPNCSFYTAGHPLDAETRNKGLEYAKPIKVGNNVWIGGNVIVLPGVTIGDNVVIGAGSVVNKDIPSNVVAVGNPCKIIKEI